MHLSLSSLHLKNFKSFADTGQVPIRKLTVIFGRNNVGKSSLLQGLLLLRQTHDAPEFGPRLTLRGNVFDGGGYSDLVHKHKSSQRIGIALGVKNDIGESFLLSLEYSSDEPRAPRLAKLRLDDEEGRLVEIGRGAGQGGPYELRVRDSKAGGEARGNFSFPARSLFPLIGTEPRSQGRPNSQRQNARATARSILFDVERMLEELRAIGPYRRQPQRRYEYGGLARPDVDVTGQNVVDALIEDSIRRGKSRGTLLKLVNAWLDRVGKVRIMPIKSLARSARLYEVRVKDKESGRWANLTDIGSGIGQALPVIVEGLRSVQGGIFLAQEPEIHLHPDAQLGMADFLIDLAVADRTVMVETHSEHFLLRLRRRLLAEKGHSLSKDDVCILIVDKNDDGTSTIKHIELDVLAQTVGWPKGFLEDATRERIELMKAMSATAKRKDAE